MNKKFVFFLAGAFVMSGCFHKGDDEAAAGFTNVYPDPADMDQFVAANKEASAATPQTCDDTRCADPTTDDLGVYQHATQTISVQGIQFLPPDGAQLFKTSLYWNDGTSDGTSSLELGDEDTHEFYGIDYYHVKEEEEGAETNQVFIYRLSGNVDSSADDDDALLYGGMWLHTPDGGDTEVIAFTDAFGELISDDNLHPLNFKATYGAVDDETPEASGYYVDDEGEASTFFADAVLSVDFGSVLEYGNIEGTVSNDGDYHGPEFRLDLSAATSSVGTDGLYAGDTVGETGGTLIDEDWQGEWGAKFFGLYGANVPDFVHGTFGAADTDPTDAKGSILGFFLALLDPNTAPEPPSVDPTVATADQFVAANKETSAATPETCDASRCTDSTTDDLGVYQHALQSVLVEGIQFLPPDGAQLFKTSLYWNDGSDGTSSLELGDEHAREFYGKNYYHL